MTYDWRMNAIGCWNLGIRAWREKLVRAGHAEPLDDEERRQAREGTVTNDKLDAVRKG